MKSAYVRLSLQIIQWWCIAGLGMSVISVSGWYPTKSEVTIADMTIAFYLGIKQHQNKNEPRSEKTGLRRF